MKQMHRQVYLFSEIGLNSLRSFVDTSTLFAFDLDGTLAAIVSDPQQIEISTAIEKELINLKAHAVLAIITGRSREDAQKHLGLVPDYLIGNHGAEGLPGWENRLDEFKRLVAKWDGQLHALLSQSAAQGMVIENKGTSISIHYRNAPRKESTKELILRMIDQLEPKPKCLAGKCVVNLLPNAAPDKGMALLDLMRRGGYAKGFFVGDDVTDEDVFRLEIDNLFTVRIGPRARSRAGYYLKDQQEMLLLLRRINAVLIRLKR